MIAVKEYVGSWASALWGMLGDGVRLFQRDEDESVAVWIATRTLLAVFLIPLLLLGLVLYSVIAALVVAIGLSFAYIIIEAIVKGGPQSDDIPDSTAALGVVVFLAAFVDDDGRVWLMTIGAGLVVGALLL